MSMCPNCGYVATDREHRCPLCGKRLFSGIKIINNNCDPAREAEWNDGYHDDFIEGNKTGSYCDDRLEKYLNGGEHYHGTQKESYSLKTTTDTPVFPPKIAVLMVVIFSIFFPVAGPIISIMIAGKNTSPENEPAAAAAKKTAYIMLALMAIGTILSFIIGASPTN